MKRFIPYTPRFCPVCGARVFNPSLCTACEEKWEAQKNEHWLQELVKIEAEEYRARRRRQGREAPPHTLR